MTATQAKIKKPKINPPKERIEQRAFVKWFYLAYPQEKLAKFFNDGIRHPIQATVMALEGLLKGMPDVMIPVPRKPHHGLLIEFKRTSGGVVSKEQEKIIEYLNARGYKAIICCGWDAAREATIEYMKGEVW